MNIVLGIDIGGSGIKGAPVDTDTGKLTAERLRIPTPAGAQVHDVADVVAELAQHFEHKGPIGITFPGVVQHGITMSAANVDKGWIGTDADRLFTNATGQPVTLINDADAAGLAEARFGAGRSEQGVALLLTFGTGIGSALLQGGVLLPNTELGHLWLENGKEAESWASDRARERDDLDWKKWGKRVSKYLQHVEMLFSPDLYIIGGGVSKRAEKWQPYVECKTPLSIATLKNDAGIVGAALYARER